MTGDGDQTLNVERREIFKRQERSILDLSFFFCFIDPNDIGKLVAVRIRIVVNYVLMCIVWLLEV